MEAQERLSEVAVVTGDKEIVRLLAQEDAIVYPAYYCRYDGFANDVFSEYANPSIVRPASVRQARLQSRVDISFFHEAGDLAWEHPLEGQERLYHSSVRARLFKEPGTYYVGWTMYDQAGGEEAITVWLGARKVAYVRSDDDDNRVHLYVLKEPFFIDDGERLRLVTDATGGAYRIENIVLLPRLPEASARKLAILDVSAEVDRSLPGEQPLRLNWRTTIPARCRVSFTANKGEQAVTEEQQALQNHSLMLEGTRVDAEGRFRITAVAARGQQADSGSIPFASVMSLSQGKMATGRIPFRISNEVGEPASAWPITWGFPFPQGALWDLRNLRVVTEVGEVVPAQKRVQVSWADGSVRWALLDMQVNLPPAGLDLWLEYGPDVDEPAPAGIATRSSQDGLMVDAGCLRLVVTNQDCASPVRVVLLHPGNAGRQLSSDFSLGLLLTDEAGRPYDKSKVEELVLEEAGPLRAVVRIAVQHSAADGGTLFRSLLRLTAYHNKPFLRLQHTFENDNLAKLFSYIRSLMLKLAVPQGLQYISVANEAVELGGGSVNLLQPFDDSFRLEQNGRVLSSGKHAPDSVVAAGTSGAVAWVMRDFWQNYPKGWQVDGEGFAIGICPDVSSVTYPSGGIEEIRSFFYLQGGLYRFKRGMARTHDMLISFGDNGQVALAPRAQFVDQPLVRLAPRFLADTGALSAISVRGETGTEAYDRWTEQALALYEADRLETRAYGMLNFGDWFGERRSNWGDMEYDTPYGFVLEFLRGGSSQYFTLGWQAAWHLADVDTCHHHADPNLAGRQYLHSIGHVGDYYPEAYIAGAIAQEAMSWSHTWVEGLYLYGLLTGERRLLEVADRTVAVLAGAALNHYDFSNCRECGWPLRHLIGAYQATGRRQYLNGARIIVERILERQRPTGGWERLMVPGHCFHVPPRHMGNAGFMVGVLLAALKRYHEETHEQAVGESIVAAGRYLIRSMWEPEQSAFRYTSCPQSKTNPELNAQILEGIGYAWRLSGDEELKQVLLTGLEACLSSPHNSTTPPDGKDISMRMRSLPFIMHDIVQAGRTAATPL
ncbi:MAG: exo-rhamnogalacturonan lyase family protein [Anaerolineae bacterium]